jgi:hypothetical protein
MVYIEERKAIVRAVEREIDEANEIVSEPARNMSALIINVIYFWVSWVKWKWKF